MEECLLLLSSTSPSAEMLSWVQKGSAPDPMLSHAIDNGFNFKKQQSAEFSPYTELELCLGARNEVSCVAANISFHFLLLGPFAQVHSRELMEGW